MLSDADKRAKYDRLGANWQAGQDFQPPPGFDGFDFRTTSGGAGDFSDFFATLFGNGDIFSNSRRATRRQGAIPGQDVESEMELALEEAYRGGEKTVKLATREPCPDCGGDGVSRRGYCPRCSGTGVVADYMTLAVKIPPGVRDGSRIRLKGQGGEGRGGGRRGDLYLIIRVLPHPMYRVIGNDLETEITIRPDQAVMGDQVVVPTLDGPVKMRVPAGMRSGKRLRLRGKGLSDGKNDRGDQYVKMKIDLPELLLPAEEDLYRKIAEFRKK